MIFREAYYKTEKNGKPRYYYSHWIQILGFCLRKKTVSSNSEFFRMTKKGSKPTTEANPSSLPQSEQKT